MIARSAVVLSLWMAGLPGCVVLESTYEAEKERREIAEEELDVQQRQVSNLTREVRELAERIERTTLEGESLGKERTGLLNELEVVPAMPSGRVQSGGTRSGSVLNSADSRLFQVASRSAEGSVPIKPG